jgi:hypothetical protein
MRTTIVKEAYHHQVLQGSPNCYQVNPDEVYLLMLFQGDTSTRYPYDITKQRIAYFVVVF